MLIKVFSVLSMLSRLPPRVHWRRRRRGATGLLNGGGGGAIGLAKQAVEFPQYNNIILWKMTFRVQTYSYYEYVCTLNVIFQVSNNNPSRSSS